MREPRARPRAPWPAACSVPSCCRSSQLPGVVHGWGCEALNPESSEAGAKPWSSRFSSPPAAQGWALHYGQGLRDQATGECSLGQVAPNPEPQWAVDSAGKVASQNGHRGPVPRRALANPQEAGAIRIHGKNRGRGARSQGLESGPDAQKQRSLGLMTWHWVPECLGSNPASATSKSK